jgi:hypothetical protein
LFGNAEAYERFMSRWSRLLATLFVDSPIFMTRDGCLIVGPGTGSENVEVQLSRNNVQIDLVRAGLVAAYFRAFRA